MIRRNLGGLALQLYLRILRINQYHSLRLRREFRERYSIDVGLYSYGCFSALRVRGPVRIGRYCSFSETVRLIDANHPMHSFSMHPFFYDPSFGVVAESGVGTRMLVIDDDVWFGHNSIVLPRCRHIGRGAVIAAGAVVTQDVRPYTIVTGAPARELRARFPTVVVEQLEASRWWEYEPTEAMQLMQEIDWGPAGAEKSAIPIALPAA